MQVMGRLEICPEHNELIEFYREEDVPENATFEFSGVVYACSKCVSKGDDASSYQKIDKDNLLNVY